MHIFHLQFNLIIYLGIDKFVEDVPKAQIVYDRFHMQSQFDRDVLSVVRLDEDRRHKAKEKEILADISDDTDKETMKSLKQEAKTENQEYSQL